MNQTKDRSRWPLRRILRHLEIAPATYHRWLKSTGEGSPGPQVRPASSSMYATLPSERQAIIDYALTHGELRHRELAWKMLDQSVVAVISSTVYRVLGDENLVCRWMPCRLVII
ncbi:MAG: hypothetical protein IT419_00700 [Planctomycetes bacterium]|nr:hypothetical protein [Planctomycetota bacterium]